MVISAAARVSKAAIALSVTALGCVACASAPPVPYEKIAVAKASVQRAEGAGAAQSAPVELSTARDKLARADKAVIAHDYAPATDLAEQANVDAQLAEATSIQKKSHLAATDFDANMQALRQESLRGSATAQ